MTSTAFFFRIFHHHESCTFCLSFFSRQKYHFYSPDSSFFTFQLFWLLWHFQLKFNFKQRTGFAVKLSLAGGLRTAVERRLQRLLLLVLPFPARSTPWLPGSLSWVSSSWKRKWKLVLVVNYVIGQLSWTPKLAKNWTKCRARKYGQYTIVKRQPISQPILL